MRELTEIVVPCRTFGVQVRLASKDDVITPVERITLRAIGAGFDDIHALNDLLQLGERPLLDLIHDLWLAGRLIVDIQGGRLILTDEIRAAYEAGRLDRLETSERNYTVVELMQEFVSGAVIPEDGTPYPVGPYSALVPAEMTALELEHVDQAAMMAALRAHFKRTRTRSKIAQRGFISALDVVEAWLEPDQLHLMATPVGGSTQRQRWLRLEADIVLDENTNRLVFEILGPTTISATIRRDIGRELTALADRMPGQQFFRQLREQRLEDTRPAPLFGRGALDKLLARTTVLAETNPGVLDARQDELIELLDEAEAALDRAIRAQALTEVISGRADHDRAIRDLLCRAKRQLVFANPWIDLDALIRPLADGQSWISLLEAALDRGVQCVLLWGIREDANLDPSVKQALIGLGHAYPQHFRFSLRSTVVHAKFIVCDGQRALVTSYNFLQPGTSTATLELGALVRTSRDPDESEGSGEDDRGRPCEVALQLLRWSRRAFPDYEIGRRILFTADDFDLTTPPPLERRPAPDVPVSSAPAIRHWAQQWIAYADQLDVRWQQQRSTVELIEDGEHRTIFADAIRTTKRRLLVFSDRLSVDVVTDRFVALIESRLEAGTHCHFAYRREGASDLVMGPASRLRALSERSPRCTVSEADTHAKVLVADDTVTLGSLNYLSYRGEYRPGRRERTELSVRISSPRSTAEVLKLLAPALPDVPGLHATDSAAEVSRHVPVSTLHPLFAALEDTDDPAKPLTEWFESSKDPWQDVRALHDAEIGAILLERAVGGALRFGATDSPDALHWRAWLSDALWRRADFIGAALLLPPDTTSPMGLSPALAHLGAAVQRGDPFFAPPLDALGQDEAVLYLALYGLLVRGRIECTPLIDAFAARAPTPQRRWAAATLRYWGQMSSALPFPLLRRLLADRERERAIQEGYRQMYDTLVSAESMYFSFKLGQRTWGWLHRSDAFLGRMRGFYEDNDARACLDYIRVLPGLGDVLDAASLATKPVHQPFITPPKRDTCIKRLEDLRDAARRWAEAAVGEPFDPEESRRLSICIELRAKLDGLAHAKPGALGEPPLRTLLEAITPLFAARTP